MYPLGDERIFIGMGAIELKGTNRAGFDPIRERDFLLRVHRQTGDMGRVAELFAQDVVTFSQEWAQEQPIIFFKYEKGEDGTLLAGGSHAANLFAASELGGDRKQRFLDAEAQLKNGAHQVFMPSEDLKEGWNKSYMYVFIDKGDYVQGEAYEFRGTDADFLRMYQQLAHRADEKPKDVTFDTTLAFSGANVQKPKDILSAVASIHTQGVGDAQVSDYMQRMHQAVESYPLLVELHERRVAEMTQKARDEFFASAEGIVVSSHILRTLILSAEDVREDQVIDIYEYKSTSQEDLADRYRQQNEPIVLQEKPTAEAEHMPLMPYRGQDWSHVDVSETVRWAEDAAQQEPAEVLASTLHTPLIEEIILEEVAFSKPVTQSIRQTLHSMRILAERFIGEPKEKEEIRELSEVQISAKPVNTPREFFVTPRHTVVQETLIVPQGDGKTKEKMKRAREIIVLAMDSQLEEIRIPAALFALDMIVRPEDANDLKNPIVYEQVPVVFTQKTWEAVINHFFLPDVSPVLETPLIPELAEKLDQVDTTVLVWTRELVRLIDVKPKEEAIRIIRQEEQKTIVRMSGLWEIFIGLTKPEFSDVTHGGEVTAEQRLSTMNQEQDASHQEKEHELVTQFSLAFTVWLLLKLDAYSMSLRTLKNFVSSLNPIVIDERKKDGKPVSIVDALKTKQPEGLVQREATQWVLLSIIWYLAMIREQGFASKSAALPVVKKKKKKKKARQNNTQVPGVFAPLFMQKAVIFAFKS